MGEISDKEYRDLTETNVLLNSILDTTHMMVACLDPRFNFIRVNRAYAKADEKDPPFFPGKNHFVLFPNEENKKIFQRVVDTGEPAYYYAKPFEYAEHPERGESCWDWSLMPVKGTKGKVEGLVLTLVNVTERVRSEMEKENILRESTERIKALKCLYSIDKIAEKKDVSLEELFQETAKLLPPAWQYPEITCGCVDFGGKEYHNGDCSRAIAKQSADIIVNKKKAGSVRVGCYEKKPERDEGPFHKEERNLINSIAKRLGEIVERKRAEDELRASQENLRLMVSEVKDYAIFMLDSKGIVTTWNDGAQHIKGYKDNEIIGQHFSRFYTKQDIEASKPQKELEVAAAEGRYEEEGTRIRKDGSQFMANVVITALRDKSAKLIGFSKVTRDITERKQAEEGLKRQQYYLTKAQEIGGIGTWELDLLTNVLIWTDQNYRNFGVPLGTPLTYEIFLNCVHPDDRDYVNTEWMAAIDGKPYDIEHRLIVDGKVRWVREKADVNFDEKGKAIKAIGCTQDITERKQAVEELRKLKDNLEIEVEKKTKELRERVADLERYQEATSDRELRMKELRDKIEELESKLREKAPRPFDSSSTSSESLRARGKEE